MEDIVQIPNAANYEQLGFSSMEDYFAAIVASFRGSNLEESKRLLKPLSEEQGEAFISFMSTDPEFEKLKAIFSSIDLEAGIADVEDGTEEQDKGSHKPQEQFDSNNPTEVYEKKKLQDNFTKLFKGEELVAVIIPFSKEKEVALSEVTEGDKPEDAGSGTINVSDIIDKAGKVNLALFKEEDNLTPEERNQKLKELRDRLIEEENNFQDPETKSYITQSKRTLTKVWTIGR